VKGYPISSIIKLFFESLQVDVLENLAINMSHFNYILLKWTKWLGKKISLFCWRRLKEDPNDDPNFPSRWYADHSKMVHVNKESMGGCGVVYCFYYQCDWPSHYPNGWV